MEKEIWKEIAGYDGRYLVSNLGRIESVFDKKGNKRRPRLFLKPNVGKLGYNRVHFYPKDGKRPLFLVHRIVAEAFIPNPENKRTVNHKNGNKSDNRVDNLEWMTHAENQQHAYSSGIVKRRFGEAASATHKLTLEKVNEIKRLHDPIKRNGRILATQFGISPSHISFIVRGHRWV
jgi:hypothetical protein